MRKMCFYRGNITTNTFVSLYTFLMVNHGFAWLIYLLFYFFHKPYINIVLVHASFVNVSKIILDIILT